jgi:tetratricopeptide (TPR) repeat protein
MNSKTISQLSFILLFTIFTVNTVETKAQSASDYIKLGMKSEKSVDRINYFSKAIKADPSSASAYYHRGSEYFDIGNYLNTIKDLSIALKFQYSDSIKIYRMRNIAFMQMGEYDNALKDINKVIENVSYARPYYKDRGRIYLTLEQYDSALIDFQNYINSGLETKEMPQYEQIGWVYIGKSDFEQAIDYLLKGDYMAPSPNPMDVGLIITYYQLGQKEKATQILKKLISADQSLTNGQAIVDSMINSQRFYVNKKYTDLLNSIYDELISKPE